MLRGTIRSVFALSLIGVTICSLVPGETTPEIGLWDKLQHALAYAALTVCGLLGFGRRRAAIAVVTGLIVYGIVLEALQGLVTERSPSSLDAVANAVGSLVSAIVVAAVKRSRHRRP